ncbi:MAG: T9SS type A sorting domain-containing protein, partial [Bacteroidetes bacterium]|nr:T9SS type A sorting domain-containing protein [Bacteroidota bacterium]
ATGRLNIAGTLGLCRWNGTSWSSGAGFNMSQTGIYADGSQLYVGSDFGQIHIIDDTGAVSSLPSMDGSSDNIDEILSFNGEIIVAGKFASSNGTTLNNIARWDGSAWQPLGTGVSGQVRSMVVYDGELFVGGMFSNAGGKSAKFIAKWDGTNWSDVGGSMTGSGYNGVWDMKVEDGKLIAGGDFDEMGGVPAKYLAIWDGNVWSGFSLHPSEQFVTSIEFYQNRIYVGTFDFDSSHVYSHAGNLTSVEESREQHLLSFYPNPAHDQIQIEWETVKPAVSIEIVNMEGKRVVEQQLFGLARNYRFDCAKIGQGVYMIILKDGENGAVLDKRKFIKM